MKLTLTGPALCVASLALTVHAQQLVRTVAGAAGTKFGTAVISAGDQNGDGYVDLLVGAPGYNAGNGIVYCVSGQYLATGVGASTLFSVLPGTTSGTGRAFGTSLAMLGDLNGDGTPDFAVGSPGLDHVTYGTDCGAVYLINGFTHFEHACVYGTTANQHLGTSLAAVGDVTGDGKSELAAGGPGLYGQVQGTVFVLSGASMVAALNNPLPASSHSVGSLTQEAGFGTSLASGFDLDGDGVNDVAVGTPYGLGQTTVDSGAIKFMHALSPTTYFAVYRTAVANEHLGFALDARDDYDGDGVVDLVAGAPDSPGPSSAPDGRAVVLSGRKVFLGQPSPEIYVLKNGAVGGHYGIAVRASADINDDGVGDIFVGAPDYATTPFGPDKGVVWALSGATGMFIGGVVGAAHEHLGDALCGAVQDFDGDGFPEFVVAGALGDVPASDCGSVKCYRLFPSPPSTYCTGKLNSLGCTPGMSSSGAPSASAATQFLVGCFNALNQTNGLLFYSNHPNAVPFQGGTLCVKQPTHRTPIQNSGGSATGSDCTGYFNMDFNALIQSGIDPNLVAGAEVFCQYWSRDSASPSTTSLSNGLRFLVAP